MKPKALPQVLLFITLAMCTSLSVASESDASDIEAGMEHTVVLKVDGSVWSWGKNDSGQLGNGTTAPSTQPVRVSLSSHIVAISAGGYHTLALSDDGSVWAWGNNRDGQIGDGTTGRVVTPVQVAGLSGVVAIASGMNHSMALRDDGSVWAWGGNSNGQLANDSLVSSSTPVLIDLPSAITDIVAGYWDAYALGGGGKIWLWGYNAHIEPLVPSTADIFTSPVVFSGQWQDVLSGNQRSREVVLPDNSVVVVAKGIDHSVMLRPDGIVLESGVREEQVEDAFTDGGVFNANEVRWTGSVVMSLLPAQAVADGAVWRIGGRWYSSGDTAYLIEGRHALEFSAGHGWAAPSTMMVDVIKGENIVLNAAFSAQQGNLSVELAPSAAEARWRVKGGGWNNSGDVLTGLSPGEYTVEYSAQPGYRLPEEGVFVVQSNDTTTANVVFEQRAGAVIVTMGPNDVMPLGAKWRIGSGRWFDGAMSIVEVLPGTYTLEFAAVDGWDAPGAFSVNVGADGVAVSASYSQTGDAPVQVVVSEGVGPFNPVADVPGQAPGGDAPEGEETPPESFFTVAAEIDVDAIAPKEFDIGDSIVAVLDYIGAASFYALDAKRGKKYLFHSRSSGTAQLSFYDSSGDLVQTFDTSGRVDEFRFMWVAPDSDQYFVKVEFNDGWSTGSVQFNVAARGADGDFNGDGESDVIGRDDDDAISLLYMRDGAFSNKVFTQYQVGSSVPEKWKVRLIDDFNGDHKADILWRAASGHTSVWLMEGEKLDEKSGLTSEYVGGLAEDWKVTHSGDFNGDGKADLLWRHAQSGQLAIWMMDGVDVSTDSGLLARQAGGSVGWRVDGIGDFNGDGRSDLLWRHNTSGRIAIWLMDGLEYSNGSGLVVDHFVSQASRWQVAAVADFDADGRSDILWRHSRDGYLYIWFMNGATVNSDGFVTNYVDSASAWDLAQVGDFNGDGKADLLWQEADSKHLYAWIMNGLHPVGDMEAISDSATINRWNVLGGVLNHE